MYAPRVVDMSALAAWDSFYGAEPEDNDELQSDQGARSRADDYAE
jgi:hypothetical protein